MDLASEIRQAWLKEGRDVALPLDNLADTASRVAHGVMGLEMNRLREALEIACVVLNQVKDHSAEGEKSARTALVKIQQSLTD